MKRPDCKELSVLSALLWVLGAAGCGGVNANVPISPMMFMQNPAPQPASADGAAPLVAANGVPATPQ